MTVVRLCRSRYSPQDATGAERYGGRWNSPGNAILYASSSLALACLEALVHIRDVGLVPPDYVYCEVEVPPALLSQWNLSGEDALAKLESPLLAQEYGDRWLRRARPQNFRQLAWQVLHPELKGAPVQAVPSVIVPREMNYLINPNHPQYGQLRWGEPKPFRFDPRLIGSTAR
jgi:RES domain-containing protein